MKKQVFGFDVGIASIGWAVLNFDNEKFDPETGEIQEGEIKGLGVRCFEKCEDRKGNSLATTRREKRLARRSCRRKARRMQDLKAVFVEEGLISPEELKTVYTQKENKDVWDLRVEALDRLLSKQELVRVLTHLAKHRGFKSYRKAVERADKEMGAVLTAIQSNADLDINARTCAERIILQAGNGAKRNRAKKDPKTDKKEPCYNNSIPREEIRKEINLIYEKQKEGYFSESLYKKIVGSGDDTNPQTAGIIFRHRDIQSVGEMVRYCTFEPKEKRAPKNAPSAELFVALSKINHFGVFDGGVKRFLTNDEKRKLYNLLFENKTVKYSSIRSKLFKNRDDILFSDVSYKKTFDSKGKEKQPEEEKFFSLDGYHSLKNAAKELFDSIQNNFNLLDQIVTIIATEKKDEKIKQALRMLNISEELVNAFVELSFKEFIHLSLKAIYKINPYLEEGLVYYNACEKAGYNPKEHTDKLVKKYGEEEQYSEPQIYLNKIENDKWTTVPTVNRAVSQFRKVYNAMVKKYGEPDEIHIEVARDLKHSHKERFDIKNGQDRFKEEKEGLKKDLEKIVKETFNCSAKDLKIYLSNKNILKYRLYEEQCGQCIYSGKRIEIEKLFEDGYVEVDHILPYSRSLDDSLNNKVLCLTAENQQKTNCIPFEYLQPQNRWEEFVGRVNSLHLNKSKKKKLLRESFTEEEAQSFRDKNIHDTQHITRYIKRYLSEGLDYKKNQNEKVENHIRCINGNLTAFLRHKWGLEKNRDENDLHHAQDAVVIACATQKMVQFLSTVSARIENKYNWLKTKDGDIQAWYKSLKTQIEKPWDNFRSDLEQSLKTILVSRAPRHKVTGEAHLETIVTINPENEKYKASKVKSGIHVRGGLAGNGNMVRTDVFSKKNKKGKEEFYLVPVYVTDTIKKDLPNKAVVAFKPEAEWIEMDETFTFKFSLFLDDYIKIKKGEEVIEGYYSGMDRALGQISLMSHDRSNKFIVISKKMEEETNTPIKKIENTYKTGVKSLDYIKKFIVSPLGELAEVKNEKRMTFSLKKKSKK